MSVTGSYQANPSLHNAFWHLKFQGLNPNHQPPNHLFHYHKKIFGLTKGERKV
jgi:hypothetical protein